MVADQGREPGDRNMINSMTDAQRQERYGWDKKPYIWPDGSRSDRQPLNRMARMTVEYSPRPSCIPSPDPLPLIGFNAKGDVMRAPTGSKRGGSSKPLDFKPQVWGSFTPDPEFVRTETNPILSAFRDEYRVNGDVPSHTIALWLGTTYPQYTPEQVDAARLVLTRLRNVMEASA